MKSKLKHIIIGITSFLILGAGYVYAQGGTCLTYVDRIPGITLDDAQKTALGAKETEFQKKMIKLRADHAVARVDKDQALKSKSFKKDDVQKQIRKMMAIETDMEMTRLDALDELRKVLTDEQWATFSAHMGKMGPGNGKQFHKKCDTNRCPAGYGKGTGDGAGYKHGANDGKGMKDCPYSKQTVVQ